MEEDKAAAYYDELTRKGEGAARFKQGLGFSSTLKNDDVPARGSALPSSSSSFLSSFVRASSPSKAAPEFQKQAQLESIQSKLKKKPQSSTRVSRDTPRSPTRDRDGERDRDRHSKPRSRSREGRDSKHRHRPRSSSRDRDRERYIERERDRVRRSRRSSRARSDTDEERKSLRRGRGRSRSRSVSPGERRSEKKGIDFKVVNKGKNEKNGAIDYAKQIGGYDKMTPAERVKAKMKLQLSETAEKDAVNGMGSGWERFEFDKDAPLDDEEMEVADDDVALVKHIGKSFRFSTVETKREDQIKAAHDEAIFGSSSIVPSVNTEDIVEDRVEQANENDYKESAPAASLLSDKVIASQRGSWRDRARKA